MSEAHIARVRGDIREIKATLARLEARLARAEQAIIWVEAGLAATLPYLATKADLVRVETVLRPLAMKPQLPYKPNQRWRLRAAMAAAFTAAIAAGVMSALLLTYLLTHLPRH
jgi:hypothetical protein